MAELIYRYLEVLEESLRRIRQMDFTFDMILGDEDIQDLLDRRIQKAIEAAIDIAAHITAGKNLGRAEKASDLFGLLAQKKIIPKPLGEKLAKAVGFRNILVHEYAKIDYELAYSNLDEKLADLESFAVKIKGFLAKTKF